MKRRGFIAGLLAGVPFLGRIFSREKMPKIRPYARETVYVPKALTGWKAEVDRHVREIPPEAMSLDASGYRYAWRIRVRIGPARYSDLMKLLNCVNPEPFGVVGAGCLRVDELVMPDGFVHFDYHEIAWNKVRLPDGTWVDGSLPFPPGDFAAIPDPSSPGLV
jgi:hypothetical protein